MDKLYPWEVLLQAAGLWHSPMAGEGEVEWLPAYTSLLTQHILERPIVRWDRWALQGLGAFNVS